MKNWWGGLSGRERVLIAVAAILILALMVQFLLLSPLGRWHKKTDARLQAAINTQKLVAEAIAQPASLEAIDDRPIAPLVTDAATRMKLNMVQRNIIENGARVEIVFEGASLRTLNQYLLDLQDQAAIHVVRANIEPEADGLFRAQLVLSRE